MTRSAEPCLFAPDPYRADDPAAIIRAYPFALLVSAHGGLWATSIPIFFERDEDTSVLVGHMARRNPHAATLADGTSVLAVFNGPDAYISAGWYRDKPEVPTWNYVAAHVRGTIHPIDDDAGQMAVLERSTALLEKGADAPWRTENAKARVAELLPMIRSFRIRVVRIEGVTKLSQRHPASDRARVAGELEASGESGALEIAKLMRALCG